MKKHNLVPDVIAAIKQYRYVLGLRKSDIIPEYRYRITTVDRMPALQNDPNGYCFKLFGSEIIELLG